METGALVDRLFRREYARLVAGLTRRLGAGRLELAEDAAQEALLRALRTWPYAGVPERPAAWLASVARRAAVDALRRRGRDEPLETAPEGEARADADAADGEDVLRLVFLCCHPRLPIESRLALVLKTVCGFGVAEVAAGLLVRPEAVKRRLTRTYAILRDEALELAPEDAAGRAERCDAVLLALYLLFNEGYAASRDEALVRAELVAEALRLVRLVLDDPAVAGPEPEALAALFCLQASRLSARLDADGVPLSLAEQDRGLWDRALIAEGFAHLERSLAGTHETRYHLEAALAAGHAAAPTWTATDWRRMLELYDRLLAVHPSPVVALNRCVALAQVEGADAALATLARLDARAELPQRRAMEAQLLWLAGRTAEAVPAFAAAIEEERSGARRRFLERRRALCAAGDAPPDW